jgi:hypothetical protein
VNLWRLHVDVFHPESALTPTADFFRCRGGSYARPSSVSAAALICCATAPRPGAVCSCGSTGRGKEVRRKQVWRANGLVCWSTSRRRHDSEAIGPENKQMETCGGQEREWQAALSTLRVRSGKCKTQVRTSSLSSCPPAG